MLALVVDITVKEGARDRFLDAIRTQAATSLAQEGGCERFDVCEDVDDDHHFVLYEIYADEDAFALHRTTPHFERWSAVRDEVVERIASTKARVL